MSITAGETKGGEGAIDPRAAGEVPSTKGQIGG